MKSQDTPAGSAAQVGFDPSGQPYSNYKTDGQATPQSHVHPTPVRRKFTDPERALIRKWLHRVTGLVRLRQLVRGDEQLAAAIVRYSSAATVGCTWPRETDLAKLLNETDRNIR